MKAICIQMMITYTDNGITLFEEGEVVEYTAREREFIIYGAEMHSTTFFSHFKVTEGKERMSYSDFEYILCNYIFSSAVLFPNEYCGVRHLVIQDMFKGTIMITVNKREDIIRVSFNDTQEKYSTYEEAIEEIKKRR